MANKKGTGLFMVWVDIPADKEGEFNGYYNEEHLAELLAVPGVLNAARYEAVSSGPSTWLATNWKVRRSLKPTPSRIASPLREASAPDPEVSAPTSSATSMR